MQLEQNNVVFYILGSIPQILNFLLLNTNLELSTLQHLYFLLIY